MDRLERVEIGHKNMTYDRTWAKQATIFQQERLKRLISPEGIRTDYPLNFGSDYSIKCAFLILAIPGLFLYFYSLFQTSTKMCKIIHSVSGLRIQTHDFWLIIIHSSRLDKVSSYIMNYAWIDATSKEVLLVLGCSREQSL